MVAIITKRRWDGRGPDEKVEERSTKARRSEEETVDLKTAQQKLNASPSQGKGDILPGRWDESGATEDMRRQRAIFYRQAYRMTPDHFWRLYQLLSPHMKSETKQAPVRLSAALRHFAGGDSASDHGIFDPAVLEEHIWEVVEAVNRCEELNIEFPSSKESQREIAACFEFLKSDIGLNSCAGVVGSMLVWIEEPKGQDSSSSSSTEYFNEGKGRHGMHLQAVFDHDGRFLDVSLRPGSVSDVAAFEESDIHSKVEEGNFLAEGLALFGGESYSPCPRVVTPLPQAEGSKPKEDFNFFQRQFSSLAEISFTTLLQRWGVLRRALTGKLRTNKQRDLITALCKLHNFCLDDTEPMLSSLTKDLVHGLTQGSLFIGDMTNCCLLNCGNNDVEVQLKDGEIFPKQGTARTIEENLIDLTEEMATSPDSTALRRRISLSGLI